MRIIAFINEGEAIREILTHLGEPVDPACIAPACGLLLWEAAAVQSNDTLLAQPIPEFEFDQRIACDNPEILWKITVDDGQRSQGYFGECV